MPLAAQVFVCHPPLETPTGRFLGVVGVQRLLREAPSKPLGRCLDEEWEPIAADATEREVAERLAAYDVVAIPVTDRCQAAGRRGYDRRRARPHAARGLARRTRESLMARRDDLSTPRGTPGGPSYDPDAFARFAERMARFLGTGRYLAAQTVFVVVWIILNGIAFTNAWDPYPFILLNLAFSTQAAYAAPLILLAQNRQADRDRAEKSSATGRSTPARSPTPSTWRARSPASGSRSSRKPDRDDVTEAIERLTRAIEETSAVASYAGGSPRGLQPEGTELE